MHLQSLELFGFKSFADKTVFDFHEGVTAVVGPNGCGKSNLLDAVRWVLGEQSAKSLRGDEMADVIFNGTDTRKPLGYAEVSLSLTDCAQELGVDWHDVRVTRRVYRDGNSEYFLNKTLCRLRDIQSLFADTGVARSAYSMMEQGRIDMILSSRPEDRRAVFEEAAGITKYKTQKREALRKLEATDANLLRIGDVIKEVKRQIGSLQRQAGKARRYQALLADVQVLDTHHSRRKLDQLELDLAQSRRDIGTANQREQDVRATIDAAEQQLAEKRGSLDSLDAQIADLRAEVEHLQSEIGTNRSRIEFNRQRADEIGELMARAENEIIAAEAKREQQRTQIDEVNSLISEMAEAISLREAGLIRLGELTAEFRRTREARETELQSLQMTVSRGEARITALEEEIASISVRRDATAQRLNSLDVAIAQIADERGRIDNALSSARAAAETDKEAAQQLRLEMHALEEKLAHDRQALADTEREVIKLEGALSEKVSRLEVLKQLNEEGEGLAEGSRAVLKGLRDHAEIQAAVAGALVTQIEVESGFVRAVEAALGRNVSAVVLNNADAAAEIVSAITNDKLGKAALLVPELNGAEPVRRKLLPENALGWAMDKVKAPPAIHSLIQSLLRDVVVVTDLEQALRLKRMTAQFPVATQAGEFVSVEGVIFGGVSTTQKESLLARTARISDLEAEASGISTERQALRSRGEEIRAAVEAVAKQLEDVRTRHRSADLAQAAAGSSMAAIERDLAEVARKIEGYLSEKTTLRQQIDAADDRVTELQQELSRSRSDFDGALQRRTELEGQRAGVREAEEKASRELNELRLVLVREQQRHENLLNQRQPLAARDDELDELIATRRQDIATYQNRLASQTNESKAGEMAIEEQTRTREQRKAELATLSSERGDFLSAVQTFEDELRILRNSLNELHERRASEQVRESQLTMKIDSLAENVARRYHIDLRSFVPDEFTFEKTLQVQLKREQKMEGGVPATPQASSSEVAPPEADLESLIADLTRRLDDMGPVNLDAVQEFEELEERHKFLEEQNQDLTNSRRELLDVIARINSTTKKLFAETFAQVRVNFREMFAELFGGGRADLSLLDEADPLNCGIDISAKPPGKQLQTVSLLSGGERTMTAVALLFAIYMVRPSPFCVLDELDAPLDESNINRFIRVLERFADQSQFIIITHNKRTIAKADIIYGVTMEERGISKLVGMKLTERAPADVRAPERVGPQREFSMAENGHGEPSFAAR
jgi:chromosome segregation protein